MKPRFLAIITAFAFLLSGMSAQASGKFRCNVMTIQASNSGHGIDKKLSKHASLLRQSPFSAFNTFKLVDSHQYTLELGEVKKLKLTDPITGTLKLSTVAANRLYLSLTLTRSGNKPVSINGNASLGAPFFAAGFKNTIGPLIFGVACTRVQGDIVAY